MSEHVEPGPIRSFSAALAALEDGDLDADLSEAQRELIAAINDVAIEQGGTAGGKLALTVTYKVEGGVMEVRAAFTTTPPKKPRSKSMLWTTPDNDLTRANPRQPSLFRDVNATRKEVKDV
ncbi:MAG: hypothetical protein VYB54_07670 [Pseudomonadota bacterium]|nr:hypothetical protein [Pseudomonadota bacterium]